MLKLVLPKGSLESATLELFANADLTVKRNSSVDYRATIDDPRIEQVRILRPQEIPLYIEEGMFDIGITGRDWIEENNSKVVTVGELEYSKRTSNPIRVVLAVAEDSPYQSIADFPNGVRVATELPGLTSRFFKSKGIEAKILLSYGATEAKIPDIADAVVDITETGRALKAAGLKIIETILISRTELIASKQACENPVKFHQIEQIMTLLQGSLAARGRVLVKLNVAEGNIDKVIELLPSMKSPTVSKLWGNSGYAVETVVEKSSINILIPDLKDAGATDILELPLGKIVQ